MNHPHKVLTGCEESKGSRIRIVFTSDQIAELEREFDTCMFLHRTRRIEISTRLGIADRHVKVWFQNRRAKLKKINKNNENKIVIESSQKLHKIEEKIVTKSPNTKYNWYKKYPVKVLQPTNRIKKDQQTNQMPSHNQTEPIHHLTTINPSATVQKHPGKVLQSTNRVKKDQQTNQMPSLYQTEPIHHLTTINPSATVQQQQEEQHLHDHHHQYQQQQQQQQQQHQQQQQPNYSYLQQQYSYQMEFQDSIEQCFQGSGYQQYNSYPQIEQPVHQHYPYNQHQDSYLSHPQIYLATPDEFSANLQNHQQQHTVNQSRHHLPTQELVDSNSYSGFVPYKSEKELELESESLSNLILSLEDVLGLNQNEMKNFNKEDPTNIEEYFKFTEPNKQTIRKEEENSAAKPIGVLETMKVENLWESSTGNHFDVAAYLKDLEESRNNETDFYQYFETAPVKKEECQPDYQPKVPLSVNLSFENIMDPKLTFLY